MWREISSVLILFVNIKWDLLVRSECLFIILMRVISNGIGELVQCQNRMFIKFKVQHLADVSYNLI